MLQEKGLTDPPTSVKDGHARPTALQEIAKRHLLPLAVNER